MMNETEFVSEDIVAREIASLAPEDVTRIRKAAQRWRAQMLCLWKLCPKAACRKARTCSGDPDFCVERFELLASDDVRTAVESLHDGKLYGYSYDDTCVLAPPGSIEAYDVWLANLFSQEATSLPSQARETD